MQAEQPAGMEAQLTAMEWLKPEVPACELDRKYGEFLKALGAKE